MGIPVAFTGGVDRHHAGALATARINDRLPAAGAPLPHGQLNAEKEKLKERRRGRVSFSEPLPQPVCCQPSGTVILPS